jgi:hypothetical protein
MTGAAAMIVILANKKPEAFTAEGVRLIFAIMALFVSILALASTMIRRR